MTNVRKAWMTLAVGLLCGCTDAVLIGAGRGDGGVGEASFAGAGGGLADASGDVLPDLAAGGAAGTGGSAPADSGEAQATGGTTQDAGDAGADGEAGAAGAVGQEACGAQTCVTGTECCYLTASCFDPIADPGACPAPLQDGSSGKPCGADSHCKLGEYCRNVNTYMCMGQGECTVRDEATCSAFMLADTCGCDGITRFEKASCLAGVRFLSLPSDVPCGADVPATDKNYCGNNPAWCPSGTECCMITGLCVDSLQKQALCVFPAAGTYLPCASDLDCPNISGFCQGATCGAPGGCLHKATGSCQGAWEPICGCDGKSYMNVLCASQVGVAVQHQGMCDDGGT